MKQVGQLQHDKGKLEHDKKKLEDDRKALQEAWRIEPSAIALTKKLGQGGEGAVYAGSWREMGIAIKMIRRFPGVNEENWGFNNAEISAMQRLRGDRIVYFWGVGDCVMFRDQTNEAADGGGDENTSSRAEASCTCGAYLW